MAGTLIPNCTQRVPSKPLRRRPDSTTSRRSPIPITAIFRRSNTKNGLIELPNPRSRSHFGGIRAAATHPHSSAEGTEEAKENEESMSIDLRRFFELNLGKWNGSFYQFDANGNLLQNVSTKLSASSYGEDELISLVQTVTCAVEEERESRKRLRGCTRTPLCKGCLHCVCFGCKMCRFSDCGCQTCVDYLDNADI